MKYPYYKTAIYNNFYEMIKSWYDNHPNKIAIRFFKNNEIVNISYINVIKEICSIYNYCKLNDINDKHIGILAENRYEYITIYLASAFFNVIVPFDKELDFETINKSLNNFDVDVLFYTNKMKEKVLKSTKGLKIKLINIDEYYKDIIKNDYSIEDFFNEIKKVKKDKFSVLASTSGTDGEMKGVMLSQYNVMSNLRAAVENNVLKSPTLSVLPMNHTYGFNPGVLNTLYIGGELCINMDLKYLKRDLKEFNPYFIGVVPMLVEGLYNNIIREAKRTKKYKLLCRMIKISNFFLKHNIDLRKLFFGNIINKRLRLVVSGGANLDESYIKKYEELGIILLNGYGMTECSPLIAVNRECNNIPGSVGTIIKDAKVKIAKDGEILVKGPNVMLGYYKNPEATKKALVDGFFKTGDLGYVKDRVIYVTGRKKNLIILENGKNFSPELIEKKLLELSYIKECLVTTKSKNNNTLIIAKIFLDGESKTIDKDIKKINDSLPKYMNIDEYEIMEKEFEKNSSKKIRRSKYVE